MWYVIVQFNGNTYLYGKFRSIEKAQQWITVTLGWMQKREISIVELISVE